MALVSGTIIDGRIRLDAPIGEGGMGTVWRAQHYGLGVPVAVKVLNESFAKNDEARARFFREARASARIESEHVVKVYDCGISEDEVPFIVMELLEGENLERYLARRGPLPFADVRAILVQACLGLREAHTKGVVHRDIKPENLILAPREGLSPLLKIVDFGLAKHDDGPLSITRSNSTMGTPLYMSPEQVLSARDVDHRCDLWSLAVVAYHALVGRPPFEGSTFGAVCLAIHRATFDAPSRVRPDLPVALDDWFARALHLRLEERFTSADELAQSFQTACDGRAGTRASLDGMAHSTSVLPPPRRRSSAAFVYAASAALVVASVAAVGWGHAETLRAWAHGGRTTPTLGAAPTTPVVTPEPAARLPATPVPPAPSATAFSPSVPVSPAAPSAPRMPVVTPPPSSAASPEPPLAPLPVSQWRIEGRAPAHGADALAPLPPFPTPNAEGEESREEGEGSNPYEAPR